MALALQSVVAYVPLFGGQRESDEPATFHIRVLGATAFRAFAARLAQASENEGMTAQTADLYRELVAGQVARIENLTVDGGPIETGAALCEHPAVPHALVVEIERAILDASRISQDDEKN